MGQSNGIDGSYPLGYVLVAWSPSHVPYNPSANHATILPTTITEPTSFTIANNSLEWHQAIKEEYDALVKNRTWSLVPRASNTNVVDCKWLYRLKRDKNGAITRYKAKFVAKGFWQQPGIDFHETISPVVKPTTIRVVLSLAVTNNWPLLQLDVQNAFLHGNLKHHVSINQPPGFIDPQQPNHLLQRVGLSNCNIVSSSLSLDDSTAFSNSVKYRQVVGALQYVTLSQPDIAFAVNKSTRGVAIYLGSNLISWTARKQRMVSRSSIEAKYKALADTVVELTWLQALLHELGIRSSSTPILWCDNLGVTYLYLYKSITNSSIPLSKTKLQVVPRP
ncbi:nucleotide-binding alpha-beta plait domain-containing protein [Tanacetum coccineum]